MRRVTLAKVERIEARLASLLAVNTVLSIVRVDRLGVDAVALPGQTVTGNVDAWIIANPDRVAHGVTLQRVAGFSNV